MSRVLRSESATRSLAEQYGVTVSAGGGGWFEVLLTAPTGQRFEAGLHELVVAGYREDADSVTWRAARKRLADATLEDCDDPDCEWCGRGGEP